MRSMRRLYSGTRFAALLFQAALLVLFTASGIRAEPEIANPISGESLYSSQCSACHGIDGRGKTALGELFRIAPPDLTLIAARRGGWFSETIVREIIDGRHRAHGQSTMPVWGRVLTETEMIAITEHLNSLQRPFGD